MKRNFRTTLALCAVLLGGLTLLAIRFAPALFAASYLPHRFCYLAQPWLIWTNAPADAAIFVSYLILFESLFWLAWMVRAQLGPYLWILLAFGSFILTCGLTHLMEIVTIWWPVYPLSTAVKITCALVSVPTAIAFQWKVRPLAREVKQYLTEMHTSREALIASERLAAVGRLSASISHEINNPLEAVMNLIYLISTHPALPLDLNPSVKLAEEELKRVASIANHTLTYYRESAQPVRVKLREVVDAVLALERARITAAGVVITTKFVGEEPVIIAHPGEMRQILINIVENSIAALSSGGRLHISVRTVYRSDLRKGYSLRVADSGEGIPPAAMKKLFTPFFSTKGASGTGLGLWIIKQITEKHGGVLRVRSRQHVGTIVSVWLPVLANPGDGQTMQARSQYHVMSAKTEGNQA